MTPTSCSTTSAQNIDLQLTPAALEAAKKLPQGHTLRLAVVPQGCSGMSYMIRSEAAQPSDLCVEMQGARIALDAPTAKFYNGAIVDYRSPEEDLMKAGFFVAQNPNAKRSCGCGTSFEAN